MRTGKEMQGNRERYDGGVESICLQAENPLYLENNNKLKLYLKVWIIFRFGKREVQLQTIDVMIEIYFSKATAMLS